MIEINKALQRKTVGKFRHYGCPIVVELLPGDVIRLKEHGRRFSSAVCIDVHELYELLLVRKAFRERMEKGNARKAKRATGTPADNEEDEKPF
jgi:hypothetical protein